MPHVSVHIVTWNSRKYLPQALTSLAAQTYRDFSVLVVDNASTDGTMGFVREEHPEVGVLRNFNNLGFARAHNQAIAFVQARSNDANQLVLVTNPDIILEPDCLGKLVEAIERQPNIGSVCGKLRRVRAGDGEMAEPLRLDIIDSVGLQPLKSRRFVDRGSGDKDEGQYDQPTEVFGASGALALYRLSALVDVAGPGTPFDEDLFAYKEDVDLAWRLRRLGWSSWCEPSALAYHYRAAGGSERSGSWRLVREHSGRSSLVSFLSLRNHWLVCGKNDQFTNVLRHLPFIVWFEARKFVYSLFVQPLILARAIGGCLMRMPRTWRKRRSLFQRSRTSAKEMRRWFR